VSCSTNKDAIIHYTLSRNPGTGVTGSALNLANSTATPHDMTQSMITPPYYLTVNSFDNPHSLYNSTSFTLIDTPGGNTGYAYGIWASATSTDPNPSITCTSSNLTIIQLTS
jgi:carboxypeptidase C (cathepsin A)